MVLSLSPQTLAIPQRATLTPDSYAGPGRTRRVPTAARVGWHIVPTEFHLTGAAMMRISVKTRLVEPEWWY
jgi:hypothetical protein